MAKVTGPNQFSLAVGHRTTAKVDDCVGWKWEFFQINKNNIQLEKKLSFLLISNMYTSRYIFRTEWKYEWNHVENVNIVMDSNSVISEFEGFLPSDIDDPLFEIWSDISVSPVSTPETSENEESGEEEVRNDPFVSPPGATFELRTLRT